MHKYSWNLTEIWKAFQSQISPFVQSRLNKTSSLRASGCCLWVNLESKEVDVTCDKLSSSLGFSVSEESTHPTYKDLKLWNFPPQNISKCCDNQLFFPGQTFPSNRAGYEVKHKLSSVSIHFTREDVHSYRLHWFRVLFPCPNCLSYIHTCAWPSQSVTEPVAPLKRFFFLCPSLAVGDQSSSQAQQGTTLKPGFCWASQHRVISWQEYNLIRL